MNRNAYSPRGILLVAIMLVLGPVHSARSLESAEAGGSAIWLLVDGASRELRVMRGEHVLRRFPGISVGRAGIGAKLRNGDEVTPTGEFRIAWIPSKTQFHRFFGIDFPNQGAVERALEVGVIDRSTHDQLLAELALTQMPPQDTVLGGNLGIHGLGSADPQIHERYNWTRGCVALTNQQIDALAAWVGIGTRVVIR